MPVYNGEKYLAEALDSVLAQTYRDFELVISDNASDDHTEQICRSYAQGDTRIRYYRNRRNLGAPRNHNRVFELSGGEYFKWATHDDVYAPEFLEKCVHALDKDLSIILCYSKTARIDEHGTVVGTYDHKTRISSLEPHERFGHIIDVHNPCLPILGVMRAGSLRMTPLFGNYIGADRNLLAEICLIGRVYEIPEYLFFRRDHPDAYSSRFCGQGSVSGKRAANRYQENCAWWGANQLTIVHLKTCIEYSRSVKRVPLKWHERLLCYAQINSWFFREGWMLLGTDMENAFLHRSRFGSKMASGTKLILRNIVIPISKRIGE
jgi:glycosyltransferase involved in cell wall biosynthesis